MQRSAFVLLVLVLFQVCLAQREIIRVFGETTDYDTGKGMKGAAVTAWDTLSPPTVHRASVKANGKFKVDLPLGHVYRVVFESPGHASKNVVVDARDIPEKDRKAGFRMQLKIPLLVIYPSMDYGVFQRPIGISRYDPSVGEIVWDKAYIEGTSKLFEGFKERYEAAKEAAGTR